MRLNDPLAQIPGLKEARESEHLHRALSFANVPHTLCGCEVAHLTPLVRLELQLAGNAFFIGIRAMEGDIFQLLWRLNPRFSRRIISLGSAMAYFRLKRRLKKELGDKMENLRSIESNAVNFLMNMIQDLPESRDGSNTSKPYGIYIHWMAAEAYFYMSRIGMSLHEYQNTSCITLQQLHRAHRMNVEEDPEFINQSDSLLCKFASRNFRYTPPQ